MEKFDFKAVSGFLVLGVLIVLTFFLLKPLLMSIFIGIIFAFIFSPIYNFLEKKTKSKNFSATVICFLLLALIIVPAGFFLPSLVNQSFEIYVATQKIDYIGILKGVFPSLFESEEVSNQIGSVIHSFVTKTSNSIMNSLSDIIMNFPTIFLYTLVVFFVMFFALRDKDEFAEYIKSLLPFSKEVEAKLFESTKEITISILYGEIIVGLLQGVIIGAAFFIFDVPNALFLTVIACVIGIFPIIGTIIVWLPVVIYFLVQNNSFAAFGITIFGIISSNIDNFLRPVIIARRTTLHSSVVLVGMIGGLFMFGMIGVILGPLILAYLLILLEVYRSKKNNAPNVFIESEELKELKNS